jgi:hypothetical protein
MSNERKELKMRMRIIAVAILLQLILVWAAGPVRALADTKDGDFSKEASAAAEVIRVAVDKGPEIYGDVVKLFGHHPIINWMQYEKGPKFTALKLKNYDGSRMTDNFDHSPFAEANRRVRFQLVNVKKEHVDKVWWEVKSDVPGRGDGHRQVDDNEQTGHSFSIWVEKRAGKDLAYYLAGRWDRGVSEADFYRANPNATVILFLE